MKARILNIPGATYVLLEHQHGTSDVLVRGQDSAAADLRVEAELLRIRAANFIKRAEIFEEGAAVLQV